MASVLMTPNITSPARRTPGCWAHAGMSDGRLRLMAEALSATCSVPISVNSSPTLSATRAKTSFSHPTSDPFGKCCWLCRQGTSRVPPLLRLRLLLCLPYGSTALLPHPAALAHRQPDSSVKANPVTPVLGALPGH